MRFNPKARLDSGQVKHGGGGGGGLGFPTGGGSGMRVPVPRTKGGCLFYALMLIVLFAVAMCGGPNLIDDLTGINVGPNDGSRNLQANQLRAADGTDPYANCKTGEDANRDHNCARVAVVNSIQDYWESALPAATGRQYQQAATVTFSGSTQTGCGQATSAVGPFYCPADGDMSVYLDPTFFDTVLEGQLRGPDGDVVEWYVLGHEYGHHIQRLTGAMNQVKTQTGENSDAVMLELQADCYAGLWMRAAVSTEDESGEALFVEGPSDEDLRLAAEAAEAVGDDHIQKTTNGRVNPGAWTHGSSEQRIKSFKQGYESGDFGVCEWNRLPRS